MVGSYWVCHWKKTFWVRGCDGIGGLAYLLFCAAYSSRQPRVFRRLSRSCIKRSCRMFLLTCLVVQRHKLKMLVSSSSLRLPLIFHKHFSWCCYEYWKHTLYQSNTYVADVWICCHNTAYTARILASLEMVNTSENILLYDSSYFVILTYKSLSNNIIVSVNRWCLYRSICYMTCSLGILLK